MMHKQNIFSCCGKGKSRREATNQVPCRKITWNKSRDTGFKRVYGSPNQAERIRQHIPAALINVARNLLKVLPRSNVTALSIEEQQVVAKGLAESCLDSAITCNLRIAHAARPLFVALRC